jgi:hypothetical protein
MMQVDARTAPKSIPVVERTAGCTKMMYDIVMNVVRPARTSVRMVVCESLSRKVLFRKSRIVFESGGGIFGNARLGRLSLLE